MLKRLKKENNHNNSYKVTLTKLFMEKVRREYYFGYEHPEVKIDEDLSDYAHKSFRIDENSSTHFTYDFAGTDIRLSVRVASPKPQFDVRAVLAYTLKDKTEDVDKVRKTLVEKLGMCLTGKFK